MISFCKAEGGMIACVPSNSWILARDALAALECKEVREPLHIAVESLPGKHRSCLVLREISKGRDPMAMTCKDIWREVSNYVDNTISPGLRAEMEQHLAYCRHCTAIIDSVHNIVVLVADGRVFSLPIGFSERLKARLEKELLP